MLVGTGASLGTAGTGTITATNSTQVNGGALPVSKSIIGTNSSGQITDATSTTLTNNTSGTAANLSGTPMLPNGTGATTQTPGDNSAKLATTAYADAGNALKAGLTNPTFAGATVGTSPLIVTTNGALSASAVNISGAPITGGTATTTAPLVNIGSGAAGNYSTSGTMLSVNAPTGFTGNLLDMKLNGGTPSAFVVGPSGSFTSLYGATIYSNYTNFIVDGNGAHFGAAGKAFNAPLYQTATNCAVNSVSPAACGSAGAGAIVVPTTVTTYTVNTSAVTAASRIFLQPMSFAGNLPSSPTCVAPAVTSSVTVSAISAGTSFTFALASTTGQTCWQYWIIN